MRRQQASMSPLKLLVHRPTGRLQPHLRLIQLHEHDEILTQLRNATMGQSLRFRALAKREPRPELTGKQMVPLGDR
jgi:hypothetical protein